MDLDLSGKHALVCGGSAGIGLASAIELARLGAQVTLLARQPEALQAAVRQLPRPFEQPHAWIAADAGDHAGFAQVLAEQAGQRAIHILINNSGGPAAGPAMDAQASAFVAAFEQHLLGAHAAVQAVLPAMRAAGWGRIVNIISTSVREPIANLGVSNTVRGAVAAWAKTLSRELGPAGITVNNVLPGYTRTQRLQQILDDRVQRSGHSEQQVAQSMLGSVPLGRFAEPAEIAAAVAFLASPAASYITGVSLAVDGGRMQSI